MFFAPKAIVVGWYQDRLALRSPSASHIYRQVSNIRHTKSQHLKDSRTVLELSLPNPLKPDVKSITQM